MKKRTLRAEPLSLSLSCFSERVQPRGTGGEFTICLKGLSNLTGLPSRGTTTALGAPRLRRPEAPARRALQPPFDWAARHYVDLTDLLEIRPGVTLTFRKIALVAGRRRGGWFASRNVWVYLSFVILPECCIEYSLEDHCTSEGPEKD